MSDDTTGGPAEETAPPLRIQVAGTAGTDPYEVLVGHQLLGELPGLIGPAARRVAVVHPEALAGYADTPLTYSAVIGTVDLVDVHVAVPEGPPLPDTNAACCDSPWAEYAYHGKRGLVHLVLANPVEFIRPIGDVQGTLGLWKPWPALLDAIEFESEAARDAKPRHGAH